MAFIGPSTGVGGAGSLPPGPPRVDKRGGKNAKAQDEVVTGADAVDLASAVRSLKSNDQEESREDHQQSGGYTPKGTRPKGDEPPRLDVAG